MQPYAWTRCTCWASPTGPCSTASSGKTATPDTPASSASTSRTPSARAPLAAPPTTSLSWPGRGECSETPPPSPTSRPRKPRSPRTEEEEAGDARPRAGRAEWGSRAEGCGGLPPPSLWFISSLRSGSDEVVLC